MKKNRVLLLLLAIVMSLSVFSACGGGGRSEDEQPVDYEKTQLNVGCWNGDFGLEWLRKTAKRFEEFYKDESFEPGKKGVQVWVNTAGYAYDYHTTFLTDTNDIAIGEQDNYYGFVNAGTALDITDAVTTPLTEYGETKSIEDKFINGQEDISYYGSLAVKDTKTYYGLPWYESFMGFQYDIDYFTDNNLYFAADGFGINGFVTNRNMPKSNGPDGVENTADDGLPATYDDFFKLLDKIYDLGDEPIAWAGNAQVYINNLLTSLAADYEGYDQMRVHYTLNGRSDNIVDSINPDGSANVVGADIDSSNGYLLRRSAGLYNGLKFIEKIATTKENGQYKYFNVVHCTTTNYNHRFAQRKFLEGGFVEGASRVGILIDGTWWYAGAANIFNEMSSLPGAAANERNIGLMPIPKADSSRIGEATYINNWPTSMHIRANVSSAIANVAKRFLRFLHTDESLSEFSMVTSGTRPFDYSILPEHLEQTSTYCKQLMALRSTAKIVNPWSETPLVLDNLNDFMLNNTLYETIVGTKSYTMISSAFIADGVSARDYFNGLVKNNKAEWDNAYSKYYE